MDYTRKSNAVFLIQQIYESLSAYTKKLENYTRNADYNLTARQFMALTTIDLMAPGEATMANIAVKLKTTKQNVNKLIPKLEAKGYVVRVTGSKYNKSAVIVVTELGRNKRLEYSDQISHIASALFKEFTEDEIDTLLYLLRKLK
ncbi:MAG: MarR family transcriptional regulator [Oscillospiraceae bacterium]|nr:MarR family transcriptional regulator [Oscillospiraceae bacterium]